MFYLFAFLILVGGGFLLFKVKDRMIVPTFALMMFLITLDFIFFNKG